MSTEQPLLEARELVKRYSGRTVVDRVSFSVHAGEIVGLLGRNGAGKTTSFRISIGMIKSEGGTVSFDGRDVTGLPMYKRAQLGMGYLSQEPSIFQRLTVEQNLLAILETMKNLSRHDRRARASELMDQFGIGHLRAQQARTLSGGERRKLEIARAIQKPKGKSAVALRIAERFIEEFGQIIAEADTSVLPADLANLKGVVQSFLTGMGKEGMVLDVPEKVKR